MYVSLAQICLKGRTAEEIITWQPWADQLNDLHASIKLNAGSIGETQAPTLAITGSFTTTVKADMVVDDDSEPDEVEQSRTHHVEQLALRLTHGA